MGVKKATEDNTVRKSAVACGREEVEVVDGVDGGWGRMSVSVLVGRLVRVTVENLVGLLIEQHGKLWVGLIFERAKVCMRCVLKIL